MQTKTIGMRVERTKGAQRMALNPDQVDHESFTNKRLEAGQMRSLSWSGKEEGERVGFQQRDQHVERFVGLRNHTEL